jgi:16S rRNA (guanine527-N7)-methyltransferase
VQLPNPQRFRTILQDLALEVGIGLSPASLESFIQFYLLVLKWNRGLNLTTLTSPDEFASRNVIEPLFAARYLESSITRLWDLGSGMGVPGLPIAVARPDIRVRLVEAKRKRAVFLEEAAGALGLRNVEVCNARIQELEPAAAGTCVSARAIEEMEEILGEVFRIGSGADQLLLFLGDRLAATVTDQAEGWKVERVRLPGSQARYVLDVRHETVNRAARPLPRDP